MIECVRWLDDQAVCSCPIRNRRTCAQERWSQSKQSENASSSYQNLFAVINSSINQSPLVGLYLHPFDRRYSPEWHSFPPLGTRRPHGVPKLPLPRNRRQRSDRPKDSRSWHAAMVERSSGSPSDEPGTNRHDEGNLHRLPWAPKEVFSTLNTTLGGEGFCKGSGSDQRTWHRALGDLGSDGAIIQRCFRAFERFIKGAI